MLRPRVVSALATAALLSGCATPAVESQTGPSTHSPTPSMAVGESEGEMGGCVLLADQAADVLIAAIDATSRRYSPLEEQQDPPALLGEAGLGMPEVLRLFGVRSGQPELERRGAESAQRFSEVGCVEDPDALTRLEDRLTAAALERGQSLALLQETPATPLPSGDTEDVVTDYLATYLLSIMRETLRPVEVFNVPDGFPVQFPVHPGAEVTRTQVSPGLEAEWRVTGEPGTFEEVVSFLYERLETYRPGGWTSGGGPSSRTVGPDGAVVGRTEFNVTGYGYTGTVVVEAADDSQEVLITAVLNQG